MKTIISNEAPSAIGPYSHAVISGGTVFTSGQIPILPATGELIEGGIKEQAEQVIKNLKAVLASAGSDLNHVIKTTCFLTDMANFTAFNEVYAAYFTNKPARSCVAVRALPKGALVEIEAIAEIG
jgi:2-iminobutanoate/2-iminopropanoate deaminase